MQERPTDIQTAPSAAAFDGRRAASGLPAVQGVPAGGRSRARRLAETIRWVAAAATLLGTGAAIGLLALHVLAPQRTGNQVFTQIFEPYFVAVALLAVLAMAAIARRRPASAALIILLIVAAGRYVPGSVSLPNEPGPYRVMSWNLEAGDVPAAEVMAVLDASRPGIVGLIELTPDISRALDDDTLYPHRVMLPRSGAPGLGLLSSYPIAEHQFTREPPMLRAVLEPSGADQEIVVYVAHPYLDGIDLIGIVPDVRTDRRDADITLIRHAIEADLLAGNDVIVLGDFNVTEREPAYVELTEGLHDAQRQAGFGLGLTWRPSRVESLPFGLLRIDYLLASADFQPTSAGPDCTPRGSDHCLITATFERRQRPPASATGTPPG